METYNGVLNSIGERERIQRNKLRATRRRERAEINVKLHAHMLGGLSDDNYNKRLGLAYLKSRAGEIWSEMDIRAPAVEDVSVFNPLYAISRTGYIVSPTVLNNVVGVVDFADEIPCPQRAWVALRTGNLEGQERCFVVEALEPELDYWIRFRRFFRKQYQRKSSALPFLLYEEALRNADCQEDLTLLAKVLLRRNRR